MLVPGHFEPRTFSEPEVSWTGLAAFSAGSDFTGRYRLRMRGRYSSSKSSYFTQILFSFFSYKSSGHSKSLSPSFAALDGDAIGAVAWSSLRSCSLESPPISSRWAPRAPRFPALQHWTGAPSTVRRVQAVDWLSGVCSKPSKASSCLEGGAGGFGASSTAFVFFLHII